MNIYFKNFLRVIAMLFLLLIILSLSYFKKDIPVAILIKKYATAESKFMPLMGMQVHYRDEGNGADSIPVVLIHGTSSSLLTWDSCAKLLRPTHRVIRFDLPAFALTGPNPERDYSMGYYNKFLDSFLNKLQVNQCMIVGSSLGGGIAWHFAFNHPEKVKKLILVDASGFIPTKQPKSAIGFKIAQTPVVNNIMKWITPKFVIKQSLQDVYGDKSKVTFKLEDLYFDMTIREGNRTALIDRMKIGFMLDESAKIQQINIPTLIIWGDKDQLIPVECAYRFQKSINNSALSIMKGIGHVPMEESPSVFTERLLLFINK